MIARRLFRAGGTCWCYLNDNNNALGLDGTKQEAFEQKPSSQPPGIRKKQENHTRYQGKAGRKLLLSAE